MPNVMGREFPYTPEGMAAAEQYKQSVGMRDGGSMGFRPVGYDVGGEVGLKEGLIERIMQITGMTDVGTLLEMSVPDLQNALSGLLASEQGMPSTEQGMMPPGQMMAPEQMMAPLSEMGAGNIPQPGGLPPINSQDYMPGNMPPSPQPNVGDQIGGGYRNGGLASLRRY